MSENSKISTSFSMEIISILEQFIENENRFTRSDKIKEYKKFNDLIDKKNINDPVEILKREQKIIKLFQSFKKDDYLEKSLFVYAHSIFERHFNDLIKYGIKKVLPVREKYFEFVLKKNEKLVQEKKKLFGSDFLLMSQKDKINKAIEFLPRIYEDIGYVDFAKKLFNIKNSDQFNRMVQFYYESKERRNLLTHRGRVFDETYFIKVNSKRINLFKVFSNIENIKLGKEVRVHSSYMTQVIFIMIFIFYRSYYHLMKLDKVKLEVIGNDFASDMHKFFENINVMKSEFDNFSSKYSFFMISILFNIFESDFNFENNIIFTTNHLLSIKRSAKKIDLKILKSKSHLYQGNNLHKSIYKILEGNYKEALVLLDKSQPADGADVDAFHTWEIFSEIRQMKKFKDIYKKKFGRSFKK